MSERIIKAASYSRLKDYEKCPWQLWLKAGEKRSQEHMDRSAADRGTMVHDACELYVKGEGDFIKEMAKFAEYFEDLKLRYQRGEVLVEEDWGFDQDWQPTGWWDDDVKVRMKLDNFIKQGDVAGIATDYKTGKKFGNEISHSQQGQLYAIGALLRFPKLEYVDVEFIYLDHGLKSKPKRYTRSKAMKLLGSWQERFQRLFDDREFKPKPNKINCKWCPFGPQNGDSSCEWGVDG